MKKSILYQVWSKSSTVQLNRFKKFINSPYFNVNSKSLALFNLFLREFNKRAKGDLTNESISAELFPHQNYNSQKLRLIYSDCYKLFKNFLCLEEDQRYKEDNLSLANYFKSAGNEMIYEKTIEKVEKNLDKKIYRNANYFLSKYIINKDLYDFQTNTKRLKVVPFDEVVYNFDIYYYIEKLRQGCILKAHKNTELKSETTPELQFVVQRVESDQSLLKKHPTIAIYYHCFKALSNLAQADNFDNFQNLLFKKIDLFSKDEAKELLIMGINYCAKKINNLEHDYVQKVFEIYKIGIEKDILISKKQISPFTFKNALTVAIEIGNIEWAENFVAKYVDYLPRGQKDSVYKYSTAKILVSKGEKKEAKEILTQFYSEDTLSYLSGKMLLIQLYFEDKEFDLLGNLLDSMNVYINRKKKMPYHKIHYKQVIKFTRKLMNLPPYDGQAKKLLREEIENSEVKLMKKEWFLEQVS